MRLFVAAEVPREVAAALAAATSDLRARFPSVRWEEPAKFHFTLKFLGEVHPERLPDVTAALSRSSYRGRPIEARLAGLGSFPPGRSPRVVWAGVERGGEALAGLAEAVEREFAALGFERERRAFEPHLTVGRVKDARDGARLAGALVRRAAEAFGEPFRVERLALLESTLAPGGSRYRLAHAAALGGDSAGASG